MKKKPNILILFTDQQRQDTIRALGNSRIQTPALDSLAEKASVFFNCFTPAPVCVPARFSMYSGLYPARSGCCNNNFSNSYKGRGFYSRFTDEGYQSCCVGKMHHTADLYGPMGFQRRYTQEEMSDPRDNYTNYILSSDHKNVFDYNGMRSELYYVPQISQLPAESHPSQWVGDRSLDFLRSRDRDKPFLLFSSFIHPHPPFAPPAPWNKMYRTVSQEPYMPPEPESFRPFLSDRFRLDSIGVSRQDLSLLRNYYYSCISFVDYQIGRILAELRSQCVYDETLILFASDHGEMLGDFGTMGKRTMLDGAVRIPFMIKLPGGDREDRREVCSLVDVAPTLMAQAGIEYDPEALDGIDLFGGERHQLVFSQFSSGDRGVYMAATGEEKLVWSGPESRYYYFDTSPEVRDSYAKGGPRAAWLQAELERYMGQDICKDGSGQADFFSGQNKFPYGPKRGDHSWRRQEELARMPEGYTIDI